MEKRGNTIVKYILVILIIASFLVAPSLVSAKTAAKEKPQAQVTSSHPLQEVSREKA
jgi:competence protein ComGC